MSTWTEQEVAALVDGCIDDPRDAERLRALVANDAAARAYGCRVTRLNRLLARAFPLRYGTAATAGIRSVILDPPGLFGRRWRPGAPAVASLTAMAASVVLLLGVGVGHVSNEPPPERLAVVGTVTQGGPLFGALETLPAGTPSDAGVMPLLSFMGGDGRVCREFEVVGEQIDRREFGIACREANATWRVEIVVAAPVSERDANTFVPASGAAAEALDPILRALDAGMPMDAETEAEFLSNGWEPALTLQGRPT